MNRTLRTVCALAGALALTTAAIPAASATPTTKTVSSVGLPQAPNPLDGTGDRSADFNTDWVFALGNPAGAWAEAFDDTHWRQVRLPHDWSIHLDFNTRSASGNTAGWLDGGTGWYRKAFTLANSAGKQVSVDFDGVYALATVYVNGVQIGQQHYYGYTAFSRDITSALHAPGEVNVIAVKVENPMPGSRWYSGSGIYRDVKLTVTDPVHIDRDGVYVTTPTLEADVATASPSAQVSVQTRLVGLASAGDAAVTTEVVDASGATVAQGVATPGSMADRYTHSQTIAVPNPHLWSIENPYLYTVVSTVRVAGQVVDRVETRTGLRYTTFDSNLGFFLNGQYMKLKGVCMHHDLGPLGSAVNYRATERQLQIMKAMGVNSIRTSHNPASSALIEIADRIGLTVMEEAFDMWQLQKTSQDYHLYFNANAESDIKAMVERDKNSPSVIIWSIGNEIPKNSTQSPAIAQNLVNWIKSVDTTRPTTMGENNKSDTTARNILNNVVDIAGLNYPSSGEYSTYHGSNQNGLVIGSETSSAIRTRGYYESPGSELVGDANWTTMQCSSYDNHRVSWGHTASSAWKTDRDQRYILGQYIWTGFDYIGEPTPYGQGAGDYTETAKSSYFGAVDTAGFPKDTYYLYQSQWLDVEDQPMVHLLPHWNWAPGEVVQVWAYSNARSVELFLNGVSLGTQTFSVKQNAAGQSYQEMANGDLYAKWNVPFAPGELKAVARDAGGEIIATDIIETADPAAGLKLTPDRRIIDPDGSDLSFITVDVVDGQGRFVPTADDQITFEVTGGEIAGVDNGNPISLERYQDTNQRKAFNGKALLIVKSDGSGDPIRVTAHADGLTDGRATVFAQSTKGPRELLEVLSYPATTKVGQAPTLPETVTAVYSDGTTETLPVDWALPDPSDYAAVGQFTVSGTVLDGSIDVTLDVAVIGIVAVEKVSTATVVGTTPTLPGTANILYSNGAREAAEVAWDPTEPADYDTVGDIVLVGGTVVGTTLPASASVRVAATPTAVNIALAAVAPTGSPVASFTNSGDSLPAIRDGIIQLDRETGTKNSWSNWQSAVRRNDWLGIQWTDAMPVNKIVAHFTNGTDGCQDPTTVTWTPKYIGTDGVEHDATGVVQTTVAVSGTNAGGRPAYVLTFEFDQVLATRLTLALYNPGTNCVCMTEFQVPASILTLNTNAALSDLTVDGTTVDGFDPATTGYALTLPYNAGVPAVEGTGTDNAAVTVISPARLPGTARIMVTSENGRSSRTYTVAVEREIAPLASAALSTDSTALTEDDQAETALTVLDELAESISAEEYTVAYESDDPSVVRLAGSTLLAVGAGTANVKAVVTARGATVDSNSLPITVTPGADPKVFDHFANVVLKTAVGSPPSLPERVLAYYDHGLARELLVDWAVVPPTDYAAIGHFTVQGTVSGIAQPVLANVEAVGVIAVQAVRTATIVGERPTLPRSVNVYYSDKTDAPTEVVWPALTPTELTTPGTYTLTGATAIGGVAPTAQIRVTDNYLNNGGLDVSVAKYGYNLPRITASYTWTDDSLAHISDDVVSFNDNPKNRWSNWTQTTAKRSGDWFEYVFGAEEETAYWLDEVTISWMHDSYARSAAGVTVQAWDADTETWYPVSGQVDEVVRSIPLDANGLGGEVIRYSFDKVSTSRLRLAAEAAPRDGTYQYWVLCVTEIKIYTDQIEWVPGQRLTDLIVNGQTLPGFDPAVANYSWRVPEGSVPTVAAIGAGNAAVTVVPPLSDDDAALVIVTSEDGAVTTTYRVRFAPGKPVTGVEVAPAAATVEVGANTALTATALPADAPRNEQVTWSSSDPLVASVNGSGTVFGVGVGSADVTATSLEGGFTATAAISVRDTGALAGIVEVAQAVFDLGDGIYTAASLNALSAAIAQAQAVVGSGAGQAAVDAARGQVQGALNGLALATQTGALSALVAAIGSAGPVEANYTAATWTPYAAALRAAQELLAPGANPTQAEVDAAAAALRAGFANLESKNSTEPLENLVASVNALLLAPEGYTPSTWAALVGARTAADTLLTQQEPTAAAIANALTGLQGALAGLRPAVNTSGLSGLIGTAQGLASQTGLYTPDSLADLTAAIAAAQARLGEVEQQSVVDQAAALIQSAINSLGVAVRLEALDALLAALDGAGLTKGDYTASSWHDFAAKRAAAEALTTPGAAPGQSQVDGAVSALQAAFEALAPKASTGGLTGLLAAADAMGLAGENYTPTSWATYTAALATAQGLLDRSEPTPGEIAAAQAGLSGALGGLVPAVRTGGVAELLEVADGLVDLRAIYTQASWQAVARASEDARAVLGETEDQVAVDEAAAALHAALTGLVLAPPVEDTAPVSAVLTGLMADAGALTAGAYTAASWDALAAALNKAKAVFDDANATVAQVQAASAALGRALAGLVPAPAPAPAPPAATPPVPAPPEDPPPSTENRGEAPVVARVEAAQRSVVLTKGASITISAGAYLADGTKAAAKPAWSSSKTKVVRVSASGKITARALGRATVTLKAGAKATKIAVKVVAKRQPKVSAVKATGIPKTLAVGKTAWATGLYSPANATGVKIRYTSSNPKVASVDKNGAIKAVTKGTARIAVKAGAKARTYTVTVN